MVFRFLFLSPVSLHFVARMPAQSGYGQRTTTDYFFIQTTIGK
jgi:hypothetical protein